MSNIQLTIKEKIKEELRKFCFDNKKSQKEVVEEALEIYIKKRKNKNN